MAKKEKPKCVHGLSPVYATGCPHCVHNAIRGASLCQIVGCDFRDVIGLLLKTYPTTEALRQAVDAVRLEREAAEGAKMIGGG